MTRSNKGWLGAIARSRRRGSIRLSLILLVVIPVCAMTALWAGGSAVLLDPWLRLRESRADLRATEEVWNPLRQALQAERQETLLWTAVGGDRDALDARREDTDAAADAYRQAGLESRWPEAEHFSTTSTELMSQLTQLEATRFAVDDGRLTRIDAFDAYSRATVAANDIFDPIVRSAGFGSALTEALFDMLTQMDVAEQLSQETALLSAATASGTVSVGEGEALLSSIAIREQLVGVLAPHLPPDQRRHLEDTFSLGEGASLAALELAVSVEAVSTGAGEAQQLTLPLVPDEWHDVPAAVAERFGELARVRRAALTDQASHEEGEYARRVLSGSVIGLVGVIASGLISFRITRSLLTRMSGLRKATLDLAERGLPELVDRLRHGEQVPEADRVPALDFGSDELGRVAKAFRVAHQTAVAVTLEQAELREGTRRMFLNMSRRTQVLLRRQLNVIDAMENRATEPGDLADLYTIDHLAARMRRNAESLTILSGATPGRRWHAAVPLSDVVRGAVSEVENYARVVVDGAAGQGVKSPAVADVIHLLAELIENGTVFSPPHTEVHVRPVIVAQGVAVEIEDRGLGMSEADMEAANQLLRNPPEFNLTTLGDDPRLGLIVVSHLARRHDITITLRASSYKGLMAVVLLPHEILEEPAPAVADGFPHDDRAERHLASVPHAETGRHRRILTAPGPGPVPDDGSPDGAARPSVTAPGPGPVPDDGSPDGAARPSVTGPARPQPAGGLPRRVRMTHLAPQLLEEPGVKAPAEPREPADDADDATRQARQAEEAAETERSAGQARAVLLALRRGNRRGLDAPSPSPATPPTSANGIDKETP